MTAQELQFANRAMLEGFATQLQFTGIPNVVTTKSASAYSPAQYDIIRQEEFNDQDVSVALQKYANEWLPNRQAATYNYRRAILGY